MKLLRCVLIAIAACGTPIHANQPAPLVITNVTVIDATGAPPRSGMTVVISGDRITAITDSRRFRIPKGARQIDGSGRYLIPDFGTCTSTSGSTRRSLNFLSPME
jgi:hypothetical protein